MHAALAGQGIDGFRYGLLCLDDVYEPILQPEEQDDGSVIDRVVGRTPMGKRWGLRYTECFAVEAAYQRRRVAVLEARLDELLARVATLEGAAVL